MTTIPVQRFYGASSLTVTASGYTNSVGSPVDVPLDLSAGTIINIDCSELQVTMGKSFLRLTNSTKSVDLTGKSVTLSFKTLANSNGILLQNLVIVLAGEFFASGNPVTFVTSASTVSTKPMITLLHDGSHFVIQSKTYVSSSDDNSSLPPSIYSTSKVLVAASNGNNDKVYMKYSEDNGKTWNDASGQNVYPVYPQAIAYNGLKWLAVGNQDSNRSFLSSTDGKSWILDQNNTGRFYYCECVAWSQELGLWLVGGTCPGAETMAWSDNNGNSWNGMSTNSIFQGYTCYGIATSGIYCVAVSDYYQNHIAISTNGKDWSYPYTSLSLYPSGIATNGTIWVVGGNDDGNEDRTL